MTRIIAGRAGGRRIAVPPAGTRPTSDRVREALFSALAADPGLDGAAVLDLCAGSGALGLEALSRGAAHALFVESDRRAAGVLRRNVAALGLPGRGGARRRRPRPVLAAPAGPALRRRARRPALRTPDAEVAGWLGGRAAHGWLAADAVVVVERGRGAAVPAGPRRWSARPGAALRRHGAARRVVIGPWRSAWRMTQAAIDTARARRGSVPAHEARRLPRLLRPGDQRPPRHHRPRGRPVRRGHRRRAGQQDQAQPVHRRGADRDAGGGHRRRSPTSRSTRSTACWSTTAATTASGPSSRACAPSPTSTTSCRWRR